ncbi:uncharacterized protein LOC121979508 [Zingiber officinale]|uniref:uncharacterized protein LOC121979508 n=1 Tax=Zingiber officinale TaxID=94328 RepID=UPI001C4B464A|nr:uncharacterized protein LOC121979508 [Zingiber officinale]
MATGQQKFLLVTINCFSKWVEAEPLARITENAIIKIVWQNIIYRLSIPHRLISDNGSQLTGQGLRECWVDELPSVLRALRTTPKEATGVTPFHLVYGGKAVVPMEVGVESNQVQYYDEGNAERRLMELDLVEETWAKAVVQLTVYRQRMKQNYNRRVILRSFQVSNLAWKKVKPVGDIT